MLEIVLKDVIYITSRGRLTSAYFIDTKGYAMLEIVLKDLIDITSRGRLIGPRIEPQPLTQIHEYTEEAYTLLFQIHLM
jgi:hypothetical protein